MKRLEDSLAQDPSLEQSLELTFSVDITNSVDIDNPCIEEMDLCKGFVYDPAAGGFLDSVRPAT